jgi:hypothetical protein
MAAVPDKKGKKRVKFDLSSLSFLSKWLRFL